MSCGRVESSAAMETRILTRAIELGWCEGRSSTRSHHIRVLDALALPTVSRRCPALSPSTPRAGQHAGGRCAFPSNHLLLLLLCLFAAALQPFFTTSSSSSSALSVIRRPFEVRFGWLGPLFRAGVDLRDDIHPSGLFPPLQRGGSNNRSPRMQRRSTVEPTSSLLCVRGGQLDLGSLCTTSTTGRASACASRLVRSGSNS